MQGSDTKLLFASLDGSTSTSVWNAHVSAAQRRMMLQGVDLSDYNLSDLIFRNCDLTGAKLRNVRAVGVDFERAVLSGADLTGANLCHANLNRVVAHEANFSDARLTDADLSWAQCCGCCFDRVSFTDVKLWKTNLADARFEPFEPTASQDFFTGVRKTERMPLRDFVARVGGMTNKRYRLERGLDSPLIEVPPNLAEDPEYYLKRVLSRQGLTLRVHQYDAGGISHIEIVRR